MKLTSGITREIEQIQIRLTKIKQDEQCIINKIKHDKFNKI